MLRQNDCSPGSRSIEARIAFADAIEPVARRNNPCIGGGPSQILAEVFKDSGMIRRHSRKVIQRLVHTCRKARRRHIVAQNTLVRHVRKKTGLGCELTDEMRDVFLPLGRKRLLIPRPSAEGNNDDFSALVRRFGAHQWARADESASQHHPETAPQKFAATAAHPSSDLSR